MADASRRLEVAADRRLARQAHKLERSTSTVTIIGSLTQTIRREPKAWKPPQIDAPLLVDPDELRPLGAIGTMSWFSHTLGELRERPATLTDDDVLPNRPMVQTKVGGERVYRIFDLYAPGSFAIAGVGPIPRAQRPVRMRPVDALAGISFLRGASGVTFRGPVDILNRLAGKGYPVALSPDRTSLVVSADRGSLHLPGVRETLNATGPLLLAHLRGEPLMCAVSVHKTPVPATTFTLGGTPWDGECAS